MKTQKWIPEKNEIVIYNTLPHKVLSINMGGKLVLKPIYTRAMRQIRDVDISDVSKRN